MKRVVALGVFFFARAFAQNATDISALEQTAQTRHAEWETLAKSLSERMARILPCDARYAAGIAEVSRASEARLGALADYIRGISAKAFSETASAKILLNIEEKRALEAALERADAGQEQTSVDTQSDILAQSVKERPSLEDSRQLLGKIAAMVRERAQSAEQQAGAATTAVALLRDLVTKFDARDAALQDEAAAFEAERARWNGYYAARLARAQVECSITRVAAAPAKSLPPAQGKQ